MKNCTEDKAHHENASNSVPRQLIQIDSAKALLTLLHLSVWPGLWAEQLRYNHQTSTGEEITQESVLGH